MRSFDAVPNIARQETITFTHGKKLESIHQWLLKYKQGEPYTLDIFIQKLLIEGFTTRTN